MSFVAGMLVQDCVNTGTACIKLDLFGIFIVVKTPHIVNQPISVEIFNVNQSS